MPVWVMAVAVAIAMQVCVYYFSVQAYKNLAAPAPGKWISVAWKGAFAPRESFTDVGWRYRTLAIILNILSFAVLAVAVVL